MKKKGLFSSQFWRFKSTMLALVRDLSVAHTIADGSGGSMYRSK